MTARPLSPTTHEAIMQLERAPIDPVWLEAELRELARLVDEGDTLEVAGTLARLVRQPRRTAVGRWRWRTRLKPRPPWNPPSSSSRSSGRCPRARPSKSFRAGSGARNFIPLPSILRRLSGIETAAVRLKPRGGEHEIEQQRRVAARPFRPRRCTLDGKAISGTSCRSRPAATRCSSTAPRRPANVVYTGVPRATASRFIVPPAETTRSAAATRLCASTACAGTSSDGRPSAISPCCPCVRGSTTAWTRGVGAEPAEHLRKQRVAVAVVERDVGRRANDDEHAVGSTPSASGTPRPARNPPGSTPP